MTRQELGDVLQVVANPDMVLLGQGYRQELIEQLKRKPDAPSTRVCICGEEFFENGQPYCDLCRGFIVRQGGIDGND